MLFVGMLLLAGINTFAEAPDRAEVVKRLNEAISKTNIFALPSFLLKANVQVVQDGKFVDGNYQLLWNGPDQWKEETNFPGYSEVQVGGAGKIWLKRSTSFLPASISDLHAALGFGSGSGGSQPQANRFIRLGLRPDEIVKKQHSKKERGQTATCFEIENEQKQTYDICTSDDNGTILRSASYQDADLQPVGSKLYPRQLKYLIDKTVVATVAVRELSTPATFPEGTFTAPAGTSPDPGCMNPVAAHLVEKAAPKYPDSARFAHVEGTVLLDVWVMSDGHVKVTGVESGPRRDLQQSAVDAVAQWKYEPSTCNGTPVSLETIVRVNYALQH